MRQDGPAVRHPCHECAAERRRAPRLSDGKRNTQLIVRGGLNKMARTESTMLALGTPALDFSLPDVVSGKAVSLKQFRGKRGLLVMFLCAHCPFVKHVEAQLGQLGRDYADSGLGMVAISSNDAD